ncbi:hypothetical protein CTI12_AA407720 [Artemisia annua]|uniref:Uncharacterized protein n=1 Tax=Artemisia annua TaxID=35608 RepID=A0A2U1M834_ARTAN|nr:hypothetical protein CTI12_AA407720 [Artemisia annua]
MSSTSESYPQTGSSSEQELSDDSVEFMYTVIKQYKAIQDTATSLRGYVRRDRNEAEENVDERLLFRKSDLHEAPKRHLGRRSRLETWWEWIRPRKTTETFPSHFPNLRNISYEVS